MSKNIILFFLILFFLGISLGFGKEPEALSFDFGGYGFLSDNPYKLYDEVNTVFNYNSPFFDIKIDLAAYNDGKYTPSETYMFGHYFYMNDAYVDFNIDRFSFKAGRAIHRDIVNTPYSVFISSENLPALVMDFTYEGDFFFYETRWIRLNTRSANSYNGTEKDSENYAEKGANYKVFGLHFGDLRFGFQDSITYLERAFDAEYFLNPMPEYFVELITTTEGKPWAEKDNTNSLMGFFADITKPKWYAESQILIDDINGSFLPGIEINNLWKLAWSLGGYYKFDFGKIGFYHGGALKYTYEATYSTADDYSTLPYEYTYYPATEYYLKDGTPMTLNYWENYIGYKYGENSLSFLLNFSNSYFEQTPYAFSLYSALELALNGSKSPANPWHEYSTWSQIKPHAELLDDPYIEKRLTLSVNIEKPINNFTLFFDLALGYVANELVLEDVVGGGTEAKIFISDPDKDHGIFNLTLGASYKWKLK